MDSFEEVTIVGGETKESALTGGISTSYLVGFIAKYLYDSMFP